MDTGYRSPRPSAGGRTRRTSSPSRREVTAILASQQFPGLPSAAVGRITRALATESAARAAAAARETHTPIRIPRPRTGRELPPLTRVIPRPRRALAAG